MSSEADAAFFALSGLGKGDVVYLPKRGSYAVIREMSLVKPIRLYVKVLKPAIAWRFFAPEGRRPYRIDDRNLYTFGGMFRVSLDEVQLGR